MAEDLTPKVINIYDSARFEPGGRVTQTTVVQFMVGRHGPFQHAFDAPPDRFAIQQVMDTRKAALEGLT